MFELVIDLTAAAGRGVRMPDGPEPRNSARVEALMRRLAGPLGDIGEFDPLALIDWSGEPGGGDL